MLRPIFQTATISAAALLLASASGCGKKDMDARKGPAAAGGTVVSADRFERPMGAPGFSNYELTPVMSDSEIQEMYSMLRTDLTRDPWNLCSERAHVWAYQLWKNKGIDSGKVFLFYTVTEYQDRSGRTRLRVNTGNPAGRNWIWHAAPYVAKVSGELVVLENFAGVKGPMTLQDWLKYQTNGADCAELKGTEKELMKWTCGPLTSDGQCTRGAPNMIRVPEGGPKCYFRRVPPQYVYPRDVANHDYLEFPAKDRWDERHVFNICKMVMSGSDNTPAAKCLELLNEVEHFSIEALTETTSSMLPSETGYNKAEYQTIQ